MTATTLKTASAAASPRRPCHIRRRCSKFRSSLAQRKLSCLLPSLEEKSSSCTTSNSCSCGIVDEQCSDINHDELVGLTFSLPTTVDATSQKASKCFSNDCYFMEHETFNPIQVSTINAGDDFVPSHIPTLALPPNDINIHADLYNTNQWRDEEVGNNSTSIISATALPSVQYLADTQSKDDETKMEAPATNSALSILSPNSSRRSIITIKIPPSIATFVDKDDNDLGYYSADGDDVDDDISVESNSSSSTSSTNSTNSNSVTSNRTNRSNAVHNAKRQKRTYVQFDPSSTNVIEIPNRFSYTKKQRKQIWSGHKDIRINATRNKIEFQFENWEWKNVVEEDMFYEVNGEKVHPAHVVNQPNDNDDNVDDNNEDNDDDDVNDEDNDKDDNNDDDDTAIE